MDRNAVVIGSLPGDSSELRRTMPREPTRDFFALWVNDGHRFAGAKRPAHAKHAHCEETLASLKERRARPRIDDERPLGTQREGDPMATSS